MNRSMNPTTIIGIDCAAQDKDIGLALGRSDGHECRVAEVAHGKNVASVAGTIAGWIPANEHTLLALDAPLGWPSALGECLNAHRAGDHVAPEPDMLFNRLTDKIVRDKTGKKPLEVGADRIARAARSALNLLNDVRSRTGSSIPLVVAEPIISDTVCAIEVYPAATLTVKGFIQPKYKKDIEARKKILASLETEVQISANKDLIVGSDDVLDAVVCVLAGFDFLRKDVIVPSAGELECAVKEGWIWVQDP